MSGIRTELHGWIQDEELSVAAKLIEETAATIPDRELGGNFRLRALATLSA